MGKILQIRVGAWTYNEDDVIKEWPKLSQFVWTQLEQVAPNSVRHGVTELAEFLPDTIKFSSLSQEHKKALGEVVNNVTIQLDSLRDALSRWNPTLANEKSILLEQALTNAELVFAQLQQ